MELMLIVIVLVLLFGGGGGYLGRRRGYWWLKRRCAQGAGTDGLHIPAELPRLRNLTRDRVVPNPVLCKPTI